MFSEVARTRLSPAVALAAGSRGDFEATDSSQGLEAGRESEASVLRRQL